MIGYLITRMIPQKIETINVWYLNIQIREEPYNNESVQRNIVRIKKSSKIEKE